MVIEQIKEKNSVDTQNTTMLKTKKKPTKALKRKSDGSTKDVIQKKRKTVKFVKSPEEKQEDKTPEQKVMKKRITVWDKFGADPHAKAISPEQKVVSQSDEHIKKKKTLAMTQKRKSIWDGFQAKLFPRTRMTVKMCMSEETKRMRTLVEQLRSKNLNAVRKNLTLEELIKLMEGHVTEMVNDYQAVPVIECILHVGDEVHRTAVFNMCKDSIISIAKSKYGGKVIKQMLRHCTKEEKDHIKTSFEGKIVESMENLEAAEVIDAIFHACEGDREKFKFVKEIFGGRFIHYKLPFCGSVSEVFKKYPKHRETTMKGAKEILLKVLNESIIKYDFIQSILWQYLENCEETQSEIIQIIHEHVPKFIHSENGCNIAMYCIWHGTSKDHEIIVKSLNPHARKLAMEVFGHRVLLALFHCVDDTELIKENIIKEFIANPVVLSNPSGNKVLVYLISRAEAHNFHASAVKKLKFTDFNSQRKTDFDKRRATLRLLVVKSLVDLIQTSLPSKYSDSRYANLVVTVSKHMLAFKREAIFKIVCDVMKQNPDKFVECSQFNSMVRVLMKEKRTEKQNEKYVLFCESLLNHFAEGELKPWTNTNRGCFLIVNMLESGIPSVIERVRSEMKDQKEVLKKKSFVGAKLLLEKLQ